MNKFFYRGLLAVLAAGSLLVACRKKTFGTPEPWGFYTPSYFPAATYTFDGNEQTWQRFQLGRELFYDTLLSSDQTISCATCHAITHAFAGHNTPVSAGVGGLLGTRNAPAIFNMAWSPYFMWDGSVVSFENMPVSPLTNHVEMNETIPGIITKLSQQDRYKYLFKAAYGTNEITEERIMKAFAQFMTMIISDNSKYDKVRRGEASFTVVEQQGYSLFQQKCSQCHLEPLFTDHSFRNNGLDSVFIDEGRAGVTQSADDRGKFKVPSLRNVMMTYPYMHDGRFFSMNQVLNHYSSGVHQSSTLDPTLQNGIPLTAAEKNQLIAFLKTLNDNKLIENNRLTEPVH